MNAVTKLDRTSMKNSASTCTIHCKIQVGVFRDATLYEKMKIDVPTSPQGVTVTKCRVAQRLRHPEKTRDQKAPTTVKTKMKQQLGPSIDYLKGAKGI